MSTHVIIGAGQVGQGLNHVLIRDPDNVVWLRDVEPVDVPVHWPEVIHIAFPWTETFDQDVQSYQAEYMPDLTIIHSTVPVGTSRKLGAVHSPIRGRHPYLTSSILKFTKYFGGVDFGADVAAKYFDACGVYRVVVVDQPETTEVGKMLELLHYGVIIRMQQIFYDYCEEVGADPDIAYRDFATTYNEGYTEFHDDYVVRPVIKPMSGPIGGHCVRQGSGMLLNAEKPAPELIEQLVKLLG